MAGLETGPMTWVLDENDLGQLHEAIIAAQEVVWDTETTGLIGWAEEGGKVNGGVGARQSLATFTLPMPDSEGLWDGVDPTTWILPLSHPDSPWSGRWAEVSRDIAKLLLRHQKRVTGHNLKYDVKYQAQCPVRMNIVRLMEWDTVDGTRLLEQGQPADLGTAASRAFPGLDSWKDFDFSQPGASERIPLMELGAYGGRDTYWTWRLKRYQQDRMLLLPGAPEPEDSDEIIDARSGRLAVWVAMPTVASLCQIELNAFPLDVDMTTKLLDESREISQAAMERLRYWYADDHQQGLVDLDPEHASVAPTSHWFGRLTEWGVKKKQLKILSLTPKGKPQWTKSVLNKLARQGGPDSLAATILEQRHHAKRMEFLNAWLNLQFNGVISASYNTGMATGRLSSSGPNIQQITKSLRPCFIPYDDYWVIADFDFSQIELRVAAYISRCLPMLEAFNRGDDLHRLLAAEVTMKDPKDVTDEERQMAKAVNFGLLFGLGVFGLKGYAEDNYGVTMSQDQAQAFYDAYFRKWEGLEEWHQRVGARLERDNRSISPLGRVRNFRGGGNDRNAAINAPVQGMASDLMQMAIADIQGLLPANSGRGRVEGIKVVGTVHDSAVVMLPRDNWEAKAKEVQDRMENLNPLLKYMGVELDVPIKIEATVGTRWSLKDIGQLA